MDYHLNRNGQNQGIFSGEELRRRRVAGELRGDELLWCPGMTGWQPLDKVLIIPLQPKGTNQWIVVAIVAGAMFMLVGVGLIALMIQKSKEVARTPYSKTEADSGKTKPYDYSARSSPGSSTSNSAAYLLASKPIVWNRNTLTDREVRKRAEEFRLRQWMEGYKLHGNRDPAWDAQALGFLTNWMASHYGGIYYSNLPSLGYSANQLTAKCDDPLIQVLAGVETTELHEANRRLERAVKNFEQSSHLGYPKFYAVLMLERHLISDRDDRLPVLDAKALQYFEQMLADGSIQSGDEQELAEILIYDWGADFFARNGDAVCQAIQSSDKPFNWLRAALGGESEMNAAWKARGSGYANTVSEKGWEGFHSHLASARALLTDAWEQQPEWPLAPTRMMKVALGDSGLQEMRQWFDRAVAGQIDYEPAWKEMRWGLRPRWYGDLKSMLAFGKMAVDTGRFDTDVPRKFFDSVFDIESELNKQNNHIYGREDIWPYFQKMYEGYIADPSKAEYRDGWRRTYAVIAYLAKHYDVAAKQLEAVNWQLGHFYGWGTDMSLVAPEVAARTGSASQKVTTAETYRKSGHFSEALQIYQKVEEATNLDARTREFVHDRLATLQFEKQFQAGEWVNFLPPKDFAGWTISRGAKEVRPDGMLDIFADQNGHMLYSRARVGMNFEVKGELEVLSSSTSDFQGGLVIGLPEFEKNSWYGFRIKRNSDEGDVAAFGVHWSKTQIMTPVTLNDWTNSFYFRFQDGRVTATVNGKEVFNNVPAPSNYNFSPDEVFLGLGAFNDMNQTEIRYRSIQVRKL